MKIPHILTFMASCMLAASTHAATVSYNLNYGPEAIGLPTHSVGTLSQFNPALGTLTSVTLQLDALANAGTFAWDNESNQAGFVTLSIGGTVTATSSLGGFTVTAVPAQTGGPQAVVADNEGTADFLGADSFAISGGVGSDSNSQVLTLIGDITPYIGLGNFSVDIASSLYTNVATSGGSIFGPTLPVGGNDLGTVTVTYNYTPVPEPSTMALVGLSALGFVSVFRKRKAS